MKIIKKIVKIFVNYNYIIIYALEFKIFFIHIFIYHIYLNEK